jgi:hypothetical protein
MQWIAHTEEGGEAATGSTRLVEAPIAARAARQAAQAYWRGRRSLFEKVDDSSGQVTVVLRSTSDGVRHDGTEPPSRWRCTVSEAPSGELSIHAERLNR